MEHVKVKCRDVWGVPNPKRSGDELTKFRTVVGLGPRTEPRTKRLRNEVADYDALQVHFTEARGVFLTLDKRGYFSMDNRERYERELGLIVQSAEEFIEPIEKGQN